MARQYDNLTDGEDIALEGGEMYETASGDIAVVSRVAAARQSVIRELPAIPGSIPRRPRWGGGLAASVHKSITTAEMSRMASQCRARLLANPRITKTHDVSVKRGDEGVVVLIRADAVDGRIEEKIIVRGVR